MNSTWQKEPSQTVVRNARVEDLSTIEWFHDHVIEENFGAHVLQKYRKRPNLWKWYLGTQSEVRIILLAEQQTSMSIKKAVGYAFISSDFRVTSLSTLFVSKEFRNQSVGKTLFAKVSEIARNKDEVLQALAPAGSSLVDFYEGLGGKQSGYKAISLTFSNSPIDFQVMEWPREAEVTGRLES